MLARTVKNETCLLKKVVCFKYGRTVQQKQLNYNTRRRQKRALETERETKRTEIDKRFGCSEVNQKELQNLMKEEQLD